MNFVLSFIDFERRRTNTAKSDPPTAPSAAPSTAPPSTATFIFSSPSSNVSSSYSASSNAASINSTVFCPSQSIVPTAISSSVSCLPKSSLLIPGSSPFFNFNPSNQEGQFHIVMNGLIGECKSLINIFDI